MTARVSNPSGYVQCLDALAEVFHDRGNYRAMQILIEEGVRIEASMPHPDPTRMARRVYRLGIVRDLQGQDGIPALKKAVELHEQTFGEDHLETGGVLSSAGIRYRAEGRHEEARFYLSRALRIHQQEIGPDSPEAIRDLQNLAGSYEETGDIDSAATYYERALELKDRNCGTNQEELAEMQFDVARLYINWGNYCRARELLAMSIGTRLPTKRWPTSKNRQAVIPTPSSNWSLPPKSGNPAARSAPRNWRRTWNTAPAYWTNCIVKIPPIGFARWPRQRARAPPNLPDGRTRHRGRLGGVVIARHQRLIGEERPAPRIPEPLRHSRHRISGGCSGHREHIPARFTVGKIFRNNTSRRGTVRSARRRPQLG